MFNRSADKSLRDFLKGRPRSLSARSLLSGSPGASEVAEGLEPSWSYGAEVEEDRLDRFLLGRQLNCVKAVR